MRNVRLTAMDLSAQGVNVGADLTILPFRDAAFQVVTANMVLEHLADPLPVFSEVHRVLAPGGRFVFVTPNRNHPAIRAFSMLVPAGVRRELTNKLEGRDREHIFITYYRANTPRSIRRLAQRAGFEIALLEVFAGFPIIRRLWPATVAEAIWIRVQELRPLRPLGSNLVVILRKP
jgi:SAM-dependent methyltransferase